MYSFSESSKKIEATTSTIKPTANKMSKSIMFSLVQTTPNLTIFQPLKHD